MNKLDNREQWIKDCYNKIKGFEEVDCCGNCKHSILISGGSYLRLCPFESVKDFEGNAIPIQVPYNGKCPKYKREGIQ